MKQFYLVLLMMFCLVDFCGAATMSVAFKGAEVRSKPAVASSKVLFKIAKYAPVDVVEDGGEYVKIKDVRGRQGWLHKSLLSETPGLVITGDKVNVRKGPGPDHAVVFQLTKGSGAQLLAKENNWLQIKSADGQIGWVAGFLTSAK